MLKGEKDLMKIGRLIVIVVLLALATTANAQIGVYGGPDGKTVIFIPVCIRVGSAAEKVVEDRERGVDMLTSLNSSLVSDKESTDYLIYLSRQVIETGIEADGSVATAADLAEAKGILSEKLGPMSESEKYLYSSAAVYADAHPELTSRQVEDYVMVSCQTSLAKRSRAELKEQFPQDADFLDMNSKYLR